MPVVGAAVEAVEAVVPAPSVVCVDALEAGSFLLRSQAVRLHASSKALPPAASRFFQSMIIAAFILSSDRALLLFSMGCLASIDKGKRGFSA